jgi:hypothetical protein
MRFAGLYRIGPYAVLPLEDGAGGSFDHQARALREAEGKRPSSNARPQMKQKTALRRRIAAKQLNILLDFEVRKFVH